MPSAIKERDAQEYWITRLWHSTWYTFDELMEMTGYNRTHLLRCIAFGIEMSIIKKRKTGRVVYYKIANVIVIPPLINIRSNLNV